MAGRCGRLVWSCLKVTKFRSSWCTWVHHGKKLGPIRRALLMIIRQIHRCWFWFLSSPEYTWFYSVPTCCMLVSCGTVVAAAVVELMNEWMIFDHLLCKAWVSFAVCLVTSDTEVEATNMDLTGKSVPLTFKSNLQREQSCFLRETHANILVINLF